MSGTSAFIGLSVEGVEKITFVNYDGYPYGVGRGIGSRLARDLRIILKDPLGLLWLKEKVKALRVVTDSLAFPTEEEIREYQEFAQYAHGPSSDQSWYFLLRELQGDLLRSLLVGLVVDVERQFHFYDWGYRILLDKEIFEIYLGRRNTPPKLGVFSRSQSLKDSFLYEENGYGFHAPELLVGIPFKELTVSRLKDWEERRVSRASF